jgi:hypothetical protein
MPSAPAATVSRLAAGLLARSEPNVTFGGDHLPTSPPPGHHPRLGRAHPNWKSPHVANAAAAVIEAALAGDTIRDSLGTRLRQR